eukprot:scaffold69994_cov21-Tisochrysis_lutea.AAC.1
MVTIVLPAQAEAMLPQVRPDGRQQDNQDEEVCGWGIWDRMQHWAGSVQQRGSTESPEMCTGLTDKVRGERVVSSA